MIPSCDAAVAWIRPQIQAILVLVIPGLFTDNFQAEQSAAVNKAARIALQPHAIAFVYTEPTTFATKGAGQEAYPTLVQIHGHRRR